MRISEEDSHSPKFSLPHNLDLLVRATMEIFLSDSIIRITSSHKNARGREKVDSFRDVSDLWGLSFFRTSQTIGTSEAYVQITIHATTCHFIGLRQYVQTSTSPQLARKMHQRNTRRKKREMGITQVQKRY